MTEATGTTAADGSMPKKECSSSPTFPSALPEPLSTLAALALPPGDDASLPPASQRIDELEISSRAHLLELTGGLLRENGGGGGGGGIENGGGIEDAMDVDGETSGRGEGAAMSALLSYLRGALDLCVHIARRSDVLERMDPGCDHIPESYRGMMGHGGIVRKLPFLLLEDALDTLPLAAIKTLWSLGPSAWMRDLCDPDTLFVFGSRLALIRLCNKLLRKLSNRDRDAGFAGRVMMLLASVFPLSERSAVNVLGTFNVDNVTEFETEEEFEGIRTAAPRAGEEEEEEEEGAKGAGKGKNVGGSGGVAGIDYPFYRRFWGVQEGFTDPNPMLPGRDGKFDPSRVEGFVADVRAVLAAFEGHPFPDDVARQSRSRWLSSRQKPMGDIPRPGTGKSSPLAEETAPPGDATAASSSPARHHKYLTNSQLLHLQLRDPEMRIHILTQLLIICSYLTSQIEAFLSSKPEEEKGRGGAALSDLNKLRERTEELLRVTPPHGTAHLRMVEWVLRERESVWRGWKRNKCQPEIERYAPKGGGGVADEEVDGKENKGRKRRTLMSGSLGSSCWHQPDPTSLATTVDLYSYQIDVRKDLPSISKSMASCVPTLEKHLEDYVEALDPEAGIEEAYHPRNDKPFAWRAMRLLARDNLPRFGAVRRRDGDFENVVRDIWKEKGVDIPGEVPEANPDPLKKEEEERERAARQKKDDGDAGMEDVSVGSPGVGGADERMEGEAGEEKMARMKEFAKVADELEDDMLQQQEEGEAVETYGTPEAAEGEPGRVKEKIIEKAKEQAPRKRKSEDISETKGPVETEEKEDKNGSEGTCSKRGGERDAKKIKDEACDEERGERSRDSKPTQAHGKITSNAKEESSISSCRGGDSRVHGHDEGKSEKRDERTAAGSGGSDKAKDPRPRGDADGGSSRSRDDKSRDKRRSLSPRDDKKAEPSQDERGDQGRRGISSDRRGGRSDNAPTEQQRRDGGGSCVRDTASEVRRGRAESVPTEQQRRDGNGSGSRDGPERKGPRPELVKAEPPEDHRGSSYRGGPVERRPDSTKAEPRSEVRVGALTQPTLRSGGGGPGGSHRSPSRHGSNALPLEISVPDRNGGSGRRSPDRGRGGSRDSRRGADDRRVGGDRGRREESFRGGDGRRRGGGTPGVGGGRRRRGR